MKRCFTVLITITFFLSSCVKEIEHIGLAESNITLLKGRVVEGTIHQPLPNIMLQVTNGVQTYAMSTTDNDGRFTIEVDYSKIDQSYYLWLDGGSEEVQKKEELKGMTVDEYDYRDVVLYTLPSFQYEGHIFQVAPDPRVEMTWENAMVFCENLTYAGYSDWFLPNKDELNTMYVYKDEIGGFETPWYHTSGYNNCKYWSSTTTYYYDGYYYYDDRFFYWYVDFSSGGEGYVSNSTNDLNRVRPIRRM